MSSLLCTIRAIAYRGMYRGTKGYVGNIYKGIIGGYRGASMEINKGLLHE